MNIRPHKVGLVTAVLLGGFHTFWAALVFFGVAQAIYDFILWAHMIHLSLVVGPFDPNATMSLIVITTVMGYIMGYIGALVWKKLHK